MENKGKSKTALLVFLISIFTLNLSADVNKPVKWQKSIEDLGNGVYEISFSAKIDAGWHLYGLVIPEGGPYATTFNYNDSSIFRSLEKPFSTREPERKFDKTFEMVLELFDGSVTFKQKVKLKEKSAIISGYVEFMACDDATCLPPTEDEFEFKVGSPAVSESGSKGKEEAKITPLFQTQKLDIGSESGEEQASDQISSEADSTKEKRELAESSEESSAPSDEEKPLWIIFLWAIGGGIAAIITPCVYPIIPLTVSFFSSGEPSKSTIINRALGFSLSLIAIYTAVGFVSGLFQIDLMKEITSHWIPNLIFFLLFVVFAASFFGAFEITLPSKWSNSIDQKADKGGFLGSFFMALATAVVSFSCTGLIAGVVLGSAMKGDIVSPTIGMFGFGFGFALPFAMLAFFPKLQKSMPKSGGWLNAVKVVFAFLMLLFSLIFLGLIADFIPRDLVLAAAIAILIFLGLYLIGKLKFSHDSDLPYISVPRILLAIISWTLAIFLVTGLFGAPLKKISPFLPPQHTSGINLSKISASHSSTDKTLCVDNPKYADKLHLPYELEGYYDYEEALACAKEINKPVLIDFVGHSCKNCKKMYAEVWSDQTVQKKLTKEFILLALYTDDRTKLPENEWITSTLDGRIKKTIGKKNLDFQVSKFDSNALPMYVIVDPEGNILTKSKKYYTYSNDVDAFIEFLNEGLHEFK